MIQLSKNGLVADRDDVLALRHQFEETCLVRLPSLLDRQLLSLALSSIEQGRWHERVIVSKSYSYSESTLEIGAAVNLLLFVSNSPKFLETVAEITGHESLTWFEGRLYRLMPNRGHNLNWHTDDREGRLIAMSLNLSPRRYRGGLFQMREKQSQRMVAEIANTGLGDAFLFGVSADFEHRVTDVIDGESKISFTGWFSAKQSLRERWSVISGQPRVPTGS